MTIKMKPVLSAHNEDISIENNIVLEEWMENATRIAIYYDILQYIAIYYDIILET